jgi:hypothetical protein
MTNHYHGLIETPEANLVSGMRWFQMTYTVRFNRRHRLSGHLFQGRYKAVVVDPEERGHFAALSDYIHLNPVRARIISLQERLFDYAWSSYRWYALKKHRPQWLEAGRVLGELGLEDTVEGRRLYTMRMRDRAVAELADQNAADNEQLRRGWCLGGPGFRERMLTLLEQTREKLSTAKEVDGAVRREHDSNEAGRLLREGMTCFQVSETELGGLKRSDPRKLAIARLIRGRTSVSNQWIAEKLSLGHVSSVSRYCCDKGAESEREVELRRWLEGPKK